MKIPNTFFQTIDLSSKCEIKRKGKMIGGTLPIRSSYYIVGGEKTPCMKQKPK